MKYILITIPILIIATIIYLTMNNDNKSKEKTSAASTVETIGADNSEVKGATTSSERIIKSVSAKEAKELIAEKENLKIIDIRTLQEFQGGHLENSELLDFYSNGFEESIKNLNKNIPYLIYCRTGSRSSQSLKLFEKFEFSEVYELSGGYVSWVDE